MRSISRAMIGVVAAFSALLLPTPANAAPTPDSVSIRLGHTDSNPCFGHITSSGRTVEFQAYVLFDTLYLFVRVSGVSAAAYSLNAYKVNGDSGGGSGTVYYNDGNYKSLTPIGNWPWTTGQRIRLTAFSTTLWVNFT